MELTVCKNTFRISNIMNESSLEIVFPVTGESGYKLRIHLLSGRVVENEVGYVTRGISSPHQIIVTPDEVVLGGEIFGSAP